MKFPKEKILSDAEVQNFINQNNFNLAADYLFHSQIINWNLLQANNNSLQEIQTKSFWSGSYKLVVQFNPGRIKSTSAEVNEKSIKRRKCFLCSENLPEEQMGVPILEKYVLLCNPYPILKKHFTIVSTNHESQSIKAHFNDFLALSELLSNQTLIYNGPDCGASAPDHLHFQAGSKQIIPIENDIQQLKNECGDIVFEDDSIRISFINDEIRKLIFIESNDQTKIENHFKKIYRDSQVISESNAEPMMNLLCNYSEEFGWSVVIFLRSKHRPEIYFAKESDKLIISPAAIDMGGLIISPRKEDFERVDLNILQKILNEVSLDEEKFLLIKEKVKSELT